MKRLAILTLAIALSGFATTTADAGRCSPCRGGQCAPCYPQQPTKAKHTGDYVWVQQRVGMFGWRCRWVLRPVMKVEPVQAIGAVPK